MAPLNILIIGCSIAGPTLASFLLLSPVDVSQKPRITILERASTVRPEGQNVDVRGAGVDIIRRLGLEKAIRAATTGEEGVQFVDKQNRVWGALAADKSGRIQTPTSDIEILRGRMAELCSQTSMRISDDVEAEGGPGVEYIFGDYLESLEQDGDMVQVRFAKSKETLSFDLVVGADGLQSKTRKMVWGMESEKDNLKHLGMYGGYFSIPREETDPMWRRWFHAPGRRGIMLRPDGRGERTTVHMYVVSDKDKRLPDMATKGNKGVEEQKQLLEEYFCDAGWECERLIREMKVTNDFYYDMVGQVKMNTWSKGRVVLLGDAGYCASPLSGMGTTLALTGAYNLAGALLRHPNDHASAFAEYEEKTRPLVGRAQKLAPGMPRLINPETAWGIWIMLALASFLARTRIIILLFMFRGPPADAVSVEEHGFKRQPEWIE